MSEADAVPRAETPRTVGTLTEDLRTFGLAPGTTVLVHSSLSSLGCVAGRAVASAATTRRCRSPHGVARRTP